MGRLKYADRRESSAQRGYGYKWQQARLAYLSANPLCVMCRKVGLIRSAEVVDHVVPHKGSETLFWDVANWQSLCKEHHDGDKKLIEAGKTPRPTIGADGWPVGQ